MLRYVIAALLAAAPLAAASGEEEAPGKWALAAMPNGCMVQAVSPKGTMLSVWGFAGEKELGFLLQNRGWEVEDGAKTPLEVEFAGTRSWPVEATARAHIDRDGPGLFFTVQPGGSGARSFLAAFTSAEGMRIRRDGMSVDTLPLAGSRGAIASLAQCLADHWNGPASGDSKESEADAAPASSSI
ncbi:MAG: hypothetical protein QOJ27_978 [Sphingomonadales bacterium]|jgi:hypothetical protein|nr:hypothetical protein [Sphingomonadales bacterium]